MKIRRRNQIREFFFTKIYVVKTTWLKQEELVNVIWDDLDYVFYFENELKGYLTFYKY